MLEKMIFKMYSARCVNVTLDLEKIVTLRHISE